MGAYSCVPWLLLLSINQTDAHASVNITMLLNMLLILHTEVHAVSYTLLL